MSNVLATIDRALEDFACSRDAMRWSPESPAASADAPAPPAQPKVTSVEIVVRISDGRKVTYEFSGEHAHLDVEQSLDRHPDDVDVLSEYPWACRLPGPMLLTVAVKARSLGTGAFLTMRWTPEQA